MDDRTKNVLDKLEGQCSRREYCENDVRQKALKALEGDQAAAGEVVSALVSEGYVDNFRYASAFARDKSALTGWGRVKISYALAAKGIDKATIAKALEEIEESGADRKMEAVLRAKYRTIAGEKDCKLRLLKFALSRGYEYDRVRRTVDAIIAGETADN